MDRWFAFGFVGGERHPFARWPTPSSVQASVLAAAWLRPRRLDPLPVPAVATINSVWGIAPSLQKLFTTLSACFLGSAMAALGLDTDLVKVRSLGWKPVLLAMALWANLLGVGFLLARFLVGIF